MKIHSIERKEGSNNPRDLVIASLIVFAVIVLVLYEPIQRLLGH